MGYTYSVSNLRNLLSESYESYYWLGFLMADGYLNDLGRLRLVLSNKDESHLLKYAEFIEFDGTMIRRDKQNSVGVQVMDVNVAEELRRAYRFSSNKTYDPCRIQEIPQGSCIFSLIIGIIDGDGCILKQSGGRDDAFLRIKCHKSWRDNLDYMSGVLTSMKFGIKGLSKSKITGDGYAQLTIADNEVLSAIKKEAIRLGLPILHRKWKVVPDSYFGKRQLAQHRLSVVKNMLEEGASNKEMAAATGLSPSGITNLIKRNNLK